MKTSKIKSDRALRINIRQKLRSSISGAMARALLKSRFCEIEGGLSEKLFEHRRRRDEFFSRRRRFQAKS